MRDLPQMKVKPRKSKVSGLPSPRCARSAAAWRPNSIRRVLSGWSDSENASNRARIASRNRLASASCSKPATTIIGIAHDDHVAGGLMPSPAFGPKVQDVVQVDVGKQRRDHRALPRSPVTDRHGPVFENARPKPFPDQADDALVADPMFDEPDQPFLADRVEERPDVGVQYEVHLPVGDPHHQGIERIMWSASGPEPVREPEEVFLVDRVQHHNDGALDDLVLQGSDRRAFGPGSTRGAAASVRLRYVPPAGRLRPVRSPMDTSVQIGEPWLQFCLVVIPRHAVHARGGLALQRVERQPAACRD